MYGAYPIKYEVMQRNGYCRGCDIGLIKEKDKAIKFHTYRNTGQHILLCPECVCKMFSLVTQDQLIEKWEKSND